MAANFPDPPRHVVPRWRRFADTLLNGELRPLKSAKRQPQDRWIATSKRDWNRHPREMSFAAELISSALTLGIPTEAEEAARFVLEELPGETSRGATNLARRILNLPTIENEEPPKQSRISLCSDFRSDLASLRARAKISNFNAFIWADMAWIYQSLGKTKKAERCMDVALGLAPDNRYVLRSASRMYLHNQKPDKAHRILNKAPSLLFDPWILSAELAIAPELGKASRHLRDARHFLDENSFSPFHSSELHSAFATEEMKHSFKKSLRYFQNSLFEPTENAIAQAAWASRKFNVSIEDNLSQKLISSAEAYAFSEFNNQNWESAINQAGAWGRDEPFSKRPPQFRSYTQSITGDYDGSLKTIELALCVNPDDFTLRNNRVFALAKKDEKSALAEIKKIDTSDLCPDDRAVLTATEGLLALRFGNPLDGHLLYLETINYFSKAGDKINHARAYLNYALELLRLSQSYKQQVAEALPKFKDLKKADVQVLISRIEKLIK
jgi:tetratricopeptide (TPR) repeat protein